MRRVIEEDKSDPDVWFHLGIAELGTECFAPARNAAEKAIQYSTVAQPDHLVLLMQAWHGLGDGAQVDRTIDRLAEIAPTHEAVLGRRSTYRVGNTFIDKGTAAGVASGAAGALCCILDCC